MPRNIPKKAKAAPGPFIITDDSDQPIRDTSGRPRVFSTIARATPHLQPGYKVVPDKR
jgi:hypothetical protein